MSFEIGDIVEVNYFGKRDYGIIIKIYSLQRELKHIYQIQNLLYENKKNQYFYGYDLRKLSQAEVQNLPMELL